jgi:mono/diheme cytochrome c family protein
MLAFQTRAQADNEPYRPDLTGEAAFAQYCAPCHGDDGRGSGRLTFGLSKPAPDLTRLSSRNGGAFPRKRLLKVIDGREQFLAHTEREMPIWGDLFKLEGEEAFAGKSEEDLRIQMRIDDLLDVLEGLQE